MVRSRAERENIKTASCLKIVEGAYEEVVGDEHRHSTMIENNNEHMNTKELLASKGITEKTKHHSYEYLYKTFLEVGKTLEIKKHYGETDPKELVENLIKEYGDLIWHDEDKGKKIADRYFTYAERFDKDEFPDQMYSNEKNTRLRDTINAELFLKDAEIQRITEKYEKCIEVIKRFDAGIIGMYDL